MTAQAHRCGCGEWTGEACAWTGPIEEMVVVEYMPEYLRATHEAAGNSGSYPHNGSHRVAVCLECADLLIDEDDAWATVATGCSPADYLC